MMRLHSVAILGLLTVVGSSAATIEIGGPSGLTSNYINQGTGAVCAAGAGNCVTGSTTGYIEKNYDNILFAGATSSNGTVTPTPFTGYVQNGGEPSGLTASSSGGPAFAMLSDGAAGGGAGASNNMWVSTGANSTTDSIVVPIGLYGVTNVWTMLDNEWGTLGGNDTTVTFNFGSSSNQASGYTSVPVALTDNNGTALNGQMRSAVSCSTTPGTVCSPSTNSSATFQQGAVINGVTVNEATITGSAFEYTNALGTFYGGSAGKVRLDDQDFQLPSTDSNLWLVSMTITENLANSVASAINLGVLPSETALSAITVTTNGSQAPVPTPEPTTILLLLSGLGSIGLLRFRRN